MGGKVISSLLVGIGLDFDEKSTRAVDSSFDRVKSSALKLGAVVAGAFGVNKLTTDFASSNDALGKFSETYGVIANDVAAFDRVLQKSGAQAGQFISEIEGIERLRAATKVGDFGFIEAASKAGIDTKAIIEATSATEAYLSLADTLKNATPKGRLNITNALGLSDASNTLLRNGFDVVSKLVEEEKKRRPVTRGMTDMARDFNIQTKDMITGIGRVADTISVKMLPPINDLLTGLNDWLDANQALIDSNVDQTIKTIADNIELIAIGAAVLAAPALLAGLGAVLGVMGNIAIAAAPAAAGVGGFMLGGKIQAAMTPEESDITGRAVAIVLSAFGNENATAALNAEQSARQIVSQSRLSPNDMPEVAPDIIINHKTIIDGEVIERSARRVLDNSVRTMADELGSTVQ